MTPLARELLSISDLYKNQGYSLSLDHEKGYGSLHKGKPTEVGHTRVPLRYEYETGQFFLDYAPYSNRDKNHELRGSLLAMSIAQGINDAAIVPRTYTETQATQLIKELQIRRAQSNKSWSMPTTQT